MASYPPPLEDLPIFNTLLFEKEDAVLTSKSAKNKYVKYPIAQGNNTLQSVQVNGSLNVNQGITANGSSAQQNALVLRDTTTGQTSNLFQGTTTLNINSNGSAGSLINIRSGNSSLPANLNIGDNGFLFSNKNILLDTGTGIRYSNGSVQTLPFTGFLTAGTYTNPTITFNSLGRITNVINGGTTGFFNNIIITPTNPSNPATAGINNTFNEGALISYTSTTFITSTVQIFGVPAYNISNANYTVILEYYYITIIDGVPYVNSGTLSLYPTRINDGDVYVGFLNNGLNNGTSIVYNYLETNALTAPNGRWFWNTNFNYVSIDGLGLPELYISKTGLNITLQIILSPPSGYTTFQGNGYIRILCRDNFLASSGIQIF